MRSRHTVGVGVRLQRDGRGLLSLRRQGKAPLGPLRRFAANGGFYIRILPRDTLVKLPRTFGAWTLYLDLANPLPRNLPMCMARRILPHLQAHGRDFGVRSLHVGVTGANGHSIREDGKQRRANSRDTHVLLRLRNRTLNVARNCSRAYGQLNHLGEALRLGAAADCRSWRGRGQRA